MQTSLSSILDTFRELGQLLALRSVCSAWNQVIREGVWQQVALMRVSPFAAETELLPGLQWARKHCPGLSRARNHRGPLLHWSASSKCLSTIKLKALDFMGSQVPAGRIDTLPSDLQSLSLTSTGRHLNLQHFLIAFPRLRALSADVQVPGPVGASAALTSLVVTSSNFLHDNMLSDMFSAPCQLERLSLAGCGRVHRVGPFMRQCSQMRELNLRCTRITDVDVALLAAHLPVLESLDISGCSRVVGTGLTHLASGSAVGSGALREVRAAQLRKLNDIDAVSLLDNMAAHCRPATQLKLDFSSTQIGDAALLALLPAGAARLAAQLSSDRDGTESSGCGVPGQAARLEDLLLRITRSRARAAVLQGPAPQHQQRVPSIVELRLQTCSNLGTAGLSLLAETGALASLRVLDVSQLPALRGPASAGLLPTIISAAGGCLEELAVGGAALSTEQWVPRLVVGGGSMAWREGAVLEGFQRLQSLTFDHR
eukprot:jgi/Astpho2/4245/Aster-x1209